MSRNLLLRRASRSTPGATYTTSGGKSVQADYVFLAVGAPPCTGFYDPAKLDAARRITVDESLMVKGAKGHFAIGDCAATEDAKYGESAQVAVWCCFIEAEFVATGLLLSSSSAVFRGSL